MESIIKSWNGEAVVIRRDHETDAWIYIAIHSTRLGPATGGTRMKHYSDQKEALGDALKLAAGMTYKFAVPGIERGGGKAVISIPSGLTPDGRIGLLERYGTLIHQLGGLYYTGPDMGTSSEDMDVIARTGDPYVFCRTPACGGAGSSGPITAVGVFAAIQAACAHVFGTEALNDRKVLVQGTGSVGGKLIEYLRNAGAEVIFSDVDHACVQHYRDEAGLTCIEADAVYDTDCDVFAPCAFGGVVNADTIPRLKCRIIAGGANNQLTVPEDARRLKGKGILYAPDYVVNVGGAMGIPGMENMGWTTMDAERKVAESVRSTLARIFETAEAENITTDEAAGKLAEANLSR